MVEAELARASFPHDRFLTVPAPFNTLLWRVLVMTPTGYAEGYYSLLDRTRPLEFTRYPSQPELLAGLEDEWAVRRLGWFTHGFYAVGREGDAVVMTDLCLGLEPDYFFRFQVGAVHNPLRRAGREPTPAGGAAPGPPGRTLSGIACAACP